jgi:integrase
MKGVTIMSRRGDNIRRRKDGRWEARYLKCQDDEGNRKYISVYGKTYKEVKEKRKQIILEGDQQNTKPSGYYFKDLLLDWQASNKIRLKEASISRYQNLIDAHILPELGNKQVCQISASAVNKFLADKMENGRLDGSGGLSASYVRSLALIINSALRFGTATQLCSPLNSPITKPPLPKKELSILSIEQQAILERCVLENINEEKLLIYITLYTGIRIGEACALRWEDINLDNRVIHVRYTVSRVWYMEDGKKCSRLIVGSPKTNASLRCIPICSKLYKILSIFPYRKTQGYILNNPQNDSFISPRTFEYRYKGILDECGLQHINYHALRHTFATRCVEKGVDIKSLCEVLGHANASITLNTYVHSSMELKRSQLEKLIC